MHPQRIATSTTPAPRRPVRAVLGAVLLAGTLVAGGASRPQPTPFLLGADISFLDSPMPRWPARTYQEHGTPSDELTILERHGWNAFRLRVFVSPVRQAPDNSLENTIPLARRIKAAGAVFLLDIHYSDTWADPQHQEIPVAWRSLSFDSLEDRKSTRLNSSHRRLSRMPSSA